MDERTYEAMKEAQERYTPKAMSIPGVNGISIGLKQTGGQFTDVIAICIHVAKKKPLSEIPVDERIPEQIEGFPTDVSELTPRLAEDTSKYRPVMGGIQVQVGSSYGTLGCIVKDRENGTAYALSNQHVLLNDGDKVFQPKSDPVCDQIGVTKRVILNADIDAGISDFSAFSTQYDAAIKDIGNLTGSYTVSVNDLPYPVKKRGRTTGLTTGNITNINLTIAHPEAAITMTGQQLIVGDGSPFGRPGDSGSVVVDSSKKAVGLLWGADLNYEQNYKAIASPIAKVLDQLNVDLVLSSEDVVPVPYEETILGKLDAFLAESIHGQGYWRAFRYYSSTVQHTFHITPRLYLIWLKTPRQELADALLKAIKNPDSKIPATIGGKDTATVLKKLRDGIVRTIKDEGLKEQVNLLYSDIEKNIGRSWRKAFSDKRVKAPARLAH